MQDQDVQEQPDKRCVPGSAPDAEPDPSASSSKEDLGLHFMKLLNVADSLSISINWESS